MVHNLQTLSLVSLLLTASLSAHGGQYRGPTPNAPVPVLVPGVLPPALTGPRPVPTPAPSTGARDLVAFARTWQTWWEFNKEPFLLSRVTGIPQPVTGSDDYYLGWRPASRKLDTLQPTQFDRSDRIVPALVALMDKDRNRDIQSACVIALGKLGVDGPGIELEKVIAERIQRDDQEVRESAVLALGIIARRQSFEVLSQLLSDSKEGRKLAQREKVRKRTRAYAAYGLGLLARRVGEPLLSQQVHDLLWSTLQDKELKDRDLRTAIVNGLGVMRKDTNRSADKRLAWQTVEELLPWFVEDTGATDESVQAHAAIAMARLLGRGDSSLHRRCKATFVEMLTAKKSRGAPILQSCAIALGMLTMPAEVLPEDGVVCDTLRHQWENARDQTTKQLSAIALGRIGGASNREWLAKAYGRGQKTSELPWLAIALGLLTYPDAVAGKHDLVIGDMLLEDLLESKTDETRSALAIAVGLNGHPSASDKLLRLLQKHESDSTTAGYLCIGLGLLGDQVATPTLSNVMQRSTRRPFLLQQAAVALGCLGDRHANDQLLLMLKDTDSVATLAAIASAIGRIGDRRAIDSLIEMSKDGGMPKLGRAFVAAALGGVGDKDPLPWNVPFSVDVNYATGMDTLTNGSTGVLDIL